jgi:hypothetical protein
MARQPIDQQLVLVHHKEGGPLRARIIEAAGRKPNLNSPRLNRRKEESPSPFFGQTMIWNTTVTGAKKLRRKLERESEKIRAQGFQIEITVRDRVYVGRR